MTRTSSPILWYGDLVDFGSFETAISRESPQKSISFSFVIEEVSVENRAMFYDDHFSFCRRGVERTEFKNVTYKIDIERKSERTRISSISIDVEDPKVSILLQIDDSYFVTRLLVNNVDIAASLHPLKLLTASGSLFPDFRFQRPKEDVKRDLWGSQSIEAVGPYLFKILRGAIDKRIGEKTVTMLSYRLMTSGLPTKENFISIGKDYGKRVGNIFEKISRDGSDNVYQQVSHLAYGASIPPLMRSIASYLRSIMSATLYIGSARARSERYYRYQDLAVSEIDPDGKNFPMFLNSLNKRQIEAFSQWVSSLFGYGVSVARQTGHISINLRHGNYETNIVDVGYGVSQILPVLGQIWWARERPPNRGVQSPLSILAIEQPELHLHPAHQALLADALVDETTTSIDPTSSSRKMHYIVETHSETLVNRLGELIASGKISPEDVQVVLFESDETGNKTNVRTVDFSEDGSLIDWPYGFFQATVTER